MTDEQIAALCDVALSAGADLSRDKTALIAGLIESGYLTRDDRLGTAHPRYRLTAAGQALLDDRGVGANES